MRFAPPVTAGPGASIVFQTDSFRRQRGRRLTRGRGRQQRLKLIDAHRPAHFHALQVGGGFCRRPRGRVCNVSLVLPSSSAKVTVVKPSRIAVPASSSAILVNARRSAAGSREIALHRINAAVGPRIWMRSAPPMRTSISQTGLVKPLGPHHCANCGVGPGTEHHCAGGR